MFYGFPAPMAPCPADYLLALLPVRLVCMQRGFCPSSAQWQAAWPTVMCCAPTCGARAS